MGTSNCDAVPFGEISKLKDLTKEQIEAARNRRSQFNAGLYYRSRALAKSRTSNVVTKTPLHLLHPFWDSKCFYPQRQVMAFQLTLKSDSAILLCEDAAEGRNFKLTVETMYLELNYGVFIERLREKWLESISSLALQRSVIVNRSVHHLMKKGISNARFASLFSFSVTAKTLVISMVPETAHQGSYIENRYFFQHFNMSSLKVYLSGVPLVSNSIHGSMDLSKKYGESHMYWYKNMIQTFSDTAMDITMESFWKDSFIFCLPVGSYNYGDNYVMARNNNDRKMNFLSAGVVDLDISFAQPLESNVMISINGIYDVLFKFDTEGLPMLD